MKVVSDPNRTRVVWSDGHKLWQHDIPSGRQEPLSLRIEAPVVQVYSSGHGHFSVGHYFASQRFEVTVHDFTEPSEVKARAVLDPGGNKLEGDITSWSEVPLVNVVEYFHGPRIGSYFFEIRPDCGQVQLQRIEWYDDSYDKGYENINSVLRLGREALAVVSVTRRSELILHDLNTGGKVGTVPLPGGVAGGARPLLLHNAEQEIWTVNYDTMVVVRRSDWQILRSSRLQLTDSPRSRLFVGDFSFAPDEELCVVARPYSGDILGLDVSTLEVKYVAKLGQQPLNVVALPGREVLAFDWRTEALLRGKLRPLAREDDIRVLMDPI